MPKILRSTVIPKVIEDMNKSRKKSNKTMKINSGTDILRSRYVKGNPAKEKIIQDELVNLDIAQQIYDLRQEAGLKQSELAAMIGTTASVISRLEDADYNGHSLTMLRRIATALGKRVVVKIIDRKQDLRSA